jgi:hypothetical protein
MAVLSVFRLEKEKGSNVETGGWLLVILIHGGEAAVKTCHTWRPTDQTVQGRQPEENLSFITRQLCSLASIARRSWTWR